MEHALVLAAIFYCWVHVGFYIGISAERRRVRGLNTHLDNLVERHRDNRDG
jgi:hypothetical protein